MCGNKTELPKRKATKLNGYNYSNEGVYFITICTLNKQKLLCDIVGDGIISHSVSTLKRFINKELKQNIFQRFFHDRIIRGENDYLKILNYIDTNPQKWKEDCFYTE